MSEEVAIKEGSRLASLAVRLKSIRTELDEIKQQKDALQGEESQVEGEIKAALEADGLQQVKVSGVGTLYLQSTVSARVKKENREKLFVWLDENGHGDLAQRNINAQTFAAFFREQEREDKPLPPSDIVDVFREVRAVLRASSK